MNYVIPIVAFTAAGMLIPAAGSAFAQGTKVSDPNQKICQVITATGSRLGGKKVCATRAEWEERKKLDREATEKAQTQLCVINPLTGRCGGG